MTARPTGPCHPGHLWTHDRPSARPISQLHSKLQILLPTQGPTTDLSQALSCSPHPTSSSVFSLAIPSEGLDIVPLTQMLTLGSSYSHFSVITRLDRLVLALTPQRAVVGCGEVGTVVVNPATCYSQLQYSGDPLT